MQPCVNTRMHFSCTNCLQLAPAWSIVALTKLQNPAVCCVLLQHLLPSLRCVLPAPSPLHPDPPPLPRCSPRASWCRRSPRGRVRGGGSSLAGGSLGAVLWGGALPSPLARGRGTLASLQPLPERGVVRWGLPVRQPGARALRVACRLRPMALQHSGSPGCAPWASRSAGSVQRLACDLTSHLKCCSPPPLQPCPPWPPTCAPPSP